MNRLHERLRTYRASLASVSAIVATLALAASATGCGTPSSVTRLVDGRPVDSRFIEPAAYDAYLRGALAEVAGRDSEALAAFETAAGDDPQSPDIWTRVGAIRCRLAPADSDATDAFRRALAVDGSYGPAFRALGTCLEARGDHRGSAEAYARAATVDPGVATAAASARHDGTTAGRARLVAATERYASDPEAWKALAEWARAHGDPSLYARAMTSALARDVALRAEAARAAEWLADVGHDDEARALAGHAADRVDDPFDGRRDALPPLASLLAVDDAIVAGDATIIARRLVEARVPVDAAAVRARLLGRLAVVEPLLARHAAAEPDEAKVLAVLDAPLASPGASARWAQLLVATFPGGGQRGDELVASAFADAGARGATREDGLSAEARLELAARRQVTPDAPSPALDTCHRLLALALRAPTAPETAKALSALAAAPDRLVAIASARIALAHAGSGGTAAAGAGLLPPSLDAALAPYVKADDPLALTVALELVLHRHDASAAARLRSALAAVAATDVERKLSAGAPAAVSSR